MKVTPDVAYWWVGASMVCPRCGSTLTLDETDRPYMNGDKQGRWAVICQGAHPARGQSKCNQVLLFYRPLSIVEDRPKCPACGGDGRVQTEDKEKIADAIIKAGFRRLD